MRSKEVSLQIKLVTGAPKTEVIGFMRDGALKMKVRAKPIHGRANAELVEFLAEELDVAKEDLSIVVGELSTRKVIRFQGISKAELANRIKKMISAQDP